MPLRPADVRDLIAAAERGGADYELYWEEEFGPRLDALSMDRPRHGAADEVTKALGL
jgi:hypothetical protein